MQRPADQRTCQCDHLSHHLRTFTTPTGKIGHRHLTVFDERDLFIVPGPQGHSIRVCTECALDCHCAEVENLLHSN